MSGIQYSLLAIFAVSIGLAVNGQTPNEPQTLESNQTIERQMTGAETHRYKFDVQANGFFQVRVEQKGVDVALKLIDSNGKTLATMDSPNDKKGPEILSFVAATAGNYMLEVSGFDTKAEKGNYTIRREAARMATADDRKRVAVERLFIEGMTARDTQGQAETAVKKLKEVLLGWQELKDDYLVQLTKQQVNQLILAKADAIYDEAFALFNQNTAESYQLALQKFEEASRLFQEIDDKSEKAGLSLMVSGLISKKLGNKDAALRFYAEALKFFQSNNYKNYQAITFNNIGLVFANSGENQKALDYYNQSLPLARQIGDKSREATTLSNIGVVYNSLGDKQKAIDYFTQSLLIARQIGDKLQEATTVTNIGAIYSNSGENQKALDYLIQSLLLNRELGNNQGEFVTLTIIGGAYADLDEKQKALDYFNQSLILAHQLGDKHGEATALNNIGAVYADLGEKQKALDYYNQSLPLHRQINEKNGEAATLNNLGGIYSSIGDKQKALDYYGQSWSLARQVGDRLLEARTLSNIGRVYDELGEKQKALDYFTQSLLLTRQVVDKLQEAITLTNIGGVYYALGETEKALDYYNKSLLIARQVGNKRGEAVTLSSMMYAWKILHNIKFAVFYGKQSIDLYQQLRGNITGLDKEIQKTFLKLVENNYRYLADILIEQGRLAEAKQVLDLLKDQQFFDFNHNPNEQVKQLVQTPRENESALRLGQSSEKIGQLGQQIEELKKRIGTHQPTNEETAQLQKSENDVQTATDEFLAVLKQAEIEFAKPADAKDKAGDVPATREMQTALGNLNQQTGQKTVAVYTLVGEDTFRALIVSPDGIKAVSSSIKGVELNEKALKLWGLLQSDKYDTTILSKQIYDVVFKPLELELPKDTTTIMWSLDGNLRYIPMAALWDGKHFLAEKFNHVNFTRADSERMTRNLNPNWTGLGLGTTNAQTVELLGDKINFSALPGVSEELKQVFKQPNSTSGILTGEILPDAKFTKINFLESMKQHRPVVHIASHFSFRPGDEARSFLLLGDGTPFTLNDMKKETNLFQDVDLLTLSACNTAATQADANGREVDGFAELAQRLGAGAVMATLWSVSDASTPWLMRDFYSNKLKTTNRITKTEALRKAQLALINGTATTKPLPNNEKGEVSKLQIIITPDGKRDGGNTTRAEIVYVAEKDAPAFKKDNKKPFAHPYYWSPFVLIGNWK